MKSMARTWQDNAAEFAALDEGEGWPFARLVACSVEKDNGNGNRNVRNTSGKVSAREFAEAAGTSAPRVLRYLDGWDNAARKRLVKAASRLTPDDVDTPYPTDPAKSWLDDKRALRYVDTKATNVGGRPRDAKPEDAVTIIERRGPDAVAEQMTSQQRKEMAEALKAAQWEDHRKAVTRAGGQDPNLGPVQSGMEDMQEAMAINGVLLTAALRIQALHDDSDPDRWGEVLAPRMAGGVKQINEAVATLGVPDTIEGLI